MFELIISFLLSLGYITESQILDAKVIDEGNSTYGIVVVDEIQQRWTVVFDEATSTFVIQ
jgi:hypothetical protein